MRTRMSMRMGMSMRKLAFQYSKDTSCSNVVLAPEAATYAPYSVEPYHCNNLQAHHQPRGEE